MALHYVLRTGALLAWLAAAIGVSCAGFVILSYVIAFAGTPKAWSMALLRAIVVEIASTVAIVPLWPLWFLIGGAYQAIEEGEGKAHGRRNPVILLHGFAMNRTQWLYMARKLRALGHGPIYGLNYFSLTRIDHAGKRLGRFIDHVRAREASSRGMASPSGRDEDEGSVDIVAHSMGGLVARFYIERMGGAAKVQRLITVGTPHQGTRLGRFGLGLPGARDLVGGSPLLTDLGPVRPGAAYTSIWSRADAVIQPPESSSIAPAGTDEVFDDLGHLSLILSPRVVDVIDARLRA
ncbi:MAG: hypothetical protein ABI321_12030 [Polyangia bacterium]